MPGLPSGTVSFLFTDIEGSTRIWDRHPEEMRVALARHDGLIRSAVESNDGYVFKTLGDAFCASFHTAPDGLAAALAAQRALIAEAWPAPLSLRVRIALHVGAIECRDNDYFGEPLHRAARLLMVGHGGQILMSAAFHELVRDGLADACTLMFLGDHRLRDLSRSERIYQLIAPPLPSSFPPLRSLDSPNLPNNLPRQLTSFIGREREISEVSDLLGRSSLLTLTGSGGSGKTRLSLQVGSSALEDFPEGVWQIELAPLSDPDLIPSTVAEVLGVSERAGQTVHQTLVEHMQRNRLLLLLDNCEHMIEGCARFASAVLRACPNVKILATSREPLGIGGEQTYRVPSLTLPDPRHGSPTQAVSQYEAVRLFIDRATLVRPDFTIDNQNAPAVAQVCFQLDGIPLAIELAAARVRYMPVEEICSRLTDQFRLLTGGDRTALPRQQTLRALVDWSFDLLREEERSVLIRLSVFAGGWTARAATQVCSDAPMLPWEMEELLSALADKSLIVASERPTGVRYRMLETMRQYSAEKLRQSGELAPTRQRHAQTFLAFALDSESRLRGAEQGVWLERLHTEHDNLRTAMGWCIDDDQGALTWLKLCGALGRFWDMRGHWSEGRHYLRQALGRPATEEDGLERAKALRALGQLAFRQGDYDRSEAVLNQSLELSRAQGDKSGVAVSLNTLGNVATRRGDLVRALAICNEALELQKELGDQAGIANALNSLGAVAIDQGRYDTAGKAFVESLRIWEQLGNKYGVAVALNNLANVSNDQEDYPAAQALYEQSLDYHQDLSNKNGMAIVLNNLGRVAWSVGDYPTALSRHEECLRLCKDLEDRPRSASSFEGIARARLSLDDPLLAIRLFGAASALRDRIGLPLPAKKREHVEASVKLAREAVGEEVFGGAWSEGRALSWAEAMSLVLNSPG